MISSDRCRVNEASKHIIMGRLDTLQASANEISVLATTTTDLETKIQLRRIASSIDSQVYLLRRGARKVNTREAQIEQLRSDLREYKGRALYWAGQSRMRDAEIKRLKNVIQDTASSLLGELAEFKK